MDFVDTDTETAGAGGPTTETATATTPAEKEGDGEEDEEEEEEDYVCDGCEEKIVAGDRRYHCDMCDEFDYCAACYVAFAIAVKKGQDPADAQYGHGKLHTMTLAAGPGDKRPQQETAAAAAAPTAAAASASTAR